MIISTAFAHAPMVSASPSVISVSKPTSPLDINLIATPVAHKRANLLLQVRSQLDLTDLKFELTIPTSATVQSSTIPQLDTIKASQTKTYHLTVQSESTTPFQVTVYSYASIGTDRVGDVTGVLLAVRGNNLEAVPEPQSVPPDNKEPVVVESDMAQLGSIPLPCPPSFIDEVEVSGRWQYHDHAVTASGVAQVSTLKNFRQAQLNIQRVTTAPGGGTGWSNLITTHTDNNGAFDVIVPNVSINTQQGCGDQLRVVISTIGGGNDKLRVSNLAGTAYSFASASRYSNTNLNYGILTTLNTEDGSGPGNIYDTILTAYDYIVPISGVPSSNLAVNWYLGYNPSCGSCYANNVISLNGKIATPNADGDQWDDAIIAHEFGHWVMDKFMVIPPNAGGEHGTTCNEYTTRPNLAWSEGWATFFGSASQNNSFYIDTGGGIGSSTIRDNKDIETVSRLDTTGHGNFCEWQVAATLWDIIDSNQDGSDTLQETFLEVFKATQTTYNGHLPYNINEWWYGWTNTLGNRGGNSFGAEQAMLDNFAGHQTIVGIRFELTWTTPPQDVDSHLWLPPATPFHVRWNNLGQRTPFPHAFLDIDQTTVGGPENLSIISPYQGTYTYAVFDWSDQQDATKGIAQSQAIIKIYDASLPQVSPQPIVMNVPTTGNGDWWYVLTLNGATGAITQKNLVQIASPGPYDPAPNRPNEFTK